MMLRVLFLLIIITQIPCHLEAQRGIRIGYIDTEYILENFSEYKDAQAALDKKVAVWKADIQKMLSEIKLQKEELENESVLLTKELYDERIEDIAFEESKILDFQQSIFGPRGTLITQKEELIKPIQDQIFAAVQDIASTKKFDFILDKSADVVMLYANQAYDISDRVLKTISRASNRNQAKSAKERRALEEEELIPGIDKEEEAKQKEIDDKKAEREAALEARREQRKKAAEERSKKQAELRAAKKREKEERRQQLIEARNSKNNTKETDTAKATETETDEENNTTENEQIAKNNNVVIETNLEKESTSIENDSISTKANNEDNFSKPKTAAELIKEKREQKRKDREARQKALEARKQKIKEAREERTRKAKERDSIADANKSN